MNFKILTTEQMNRISGAWLSPEQAVIFIKVPALGGIKEDIEDSHKGLRVYVPVSTSASPQLIEIRLRANEKDKLHDRGVRASIYLILAAIELAETEEEERALRELLDNAYPNGLSTTGMSYEEEAGSADLRQKRLTDEHKQLLKSLRFRDIDALSLVESAIQAALALGQLERQKRQLEAEETTTSSGSGGEVKRAQYEWIETAKMVVQNSAKALKKQKLTQEEYTNFLEPLYSALKVAEQRRDKPEPAQTNPLPEKAES